MDARRIELTRAGRLDVALAAAEPSVSRSQWRRWIVEGRVTIGAERVRRAARPVSAGSVVCVDWPVPEPSDLIPREVPFGVIYEDRALTVVDKPAGLAVHPGAADERRTLAHGLVYRDPALRDSFPEDPVRPGIVHRLDRGTSGVMVVAREPEVQADLMGQFKARTVEKEYWAWVFGRPPAQGSWCGSIARHPKDRKRQTVRSDGREAQTDYQTVAVVGASSARIRAFPVTGRTHQVRVHAHHAGVPLLGDPVYRRRGKIPTRFAAWGPARDRPALHARRLAFVHPWSGERMVFEAPLPAELEALDRAYEPL